MFKNSSYFLFLNCLFLGTLMSISSNSWLGAWMGLEINLLSFIPLMNDNTSLNSNESTLKYFLTQTIASMILLFSIISFHFFSNMNWLIFNLLFENLMMMTLFLKSGIAPFHFWFPEVASGLNWKNIFILMTWQKIAPFFLISYFLNNWLMMIGILISSMVGAINGLNQTSFKKLLIFSSINHISWMLSGMMLNESLWITYFLSYSLLNLPIILMLNMYKIFQFNQIYYNINNIIMKYFFMLNLLSLSGLPPFFGFFPKWLVMESMSFQNYYFLLWIMILFSLVTILFYLRITFSALLMNSLNTKWPLNNLLNMFSMNNVYFPIFFSVLSIFGLFSISIMFFLF